MKEIIIAALVLFPMAAKADGIKIVTQSRIEYKHTYNVDNKHYTQPDLNLRLETTMDGISKSELWVVPRLRFGFGNWKMGPEFRIPTWNTENWKLLLQAEFDIHKWK